MMWVVFVSPLSSLKLIFRFNCMGTPNWKQFDFSENKYKGVGNIYFRFEHKRIKLSLVQFIFYIQVNVKEIDLYVE